MSDQEPVQLTLGVNLDDDARFENFYIVDANEALLLELHNLSGMIYLWGGSGSGRTHLLQSLCHKESAIHKPAIYIPLAEHTNLSPGLFDGLAALDVVCLDDLQCIAGNAEWEQGLFKFFNEAKENGTRLVVSAECSPKELAVGLKDLRSRLQSIAVYKIASMSDLQSIEALKFRASKRGMELTDATAEFIYRRSNRSIDQLMQLLDKLDQVSLAEKRRLTIPLIKETMDW